MSVVMNKDLMKVFVSGDCYAQDIVVMLLKYDGPTRFKRATTLEQADMILYTGGADVSPKFYGEKAISGTHVDEGRDSFDLMIFREARKRNLLQVGICRGSQFLNVVNGGKLWQDINNHAGKSHLVLDCLSKKSIVVNSLHHQGIILHQDAYMLAYAEESTNKTSEEGRWACLDTHKNRNEKDVEAFWYSKNRCLGVQWHPELPSASSECVDKFFEYIEKYKGETA